MANNVYNTLKVLQQNVIKLTAARRVELNNKFREYNPDIMLLNATGLKDDERIKFYGYVTYQRNISGEEHSGVAIAVKQGIRCAIQDHFEVC